MGWEEGRKERGRGGGKEGNREGRDGRREGRKKGGEGWEEGRMDRRKEEEMVGGEWKSLSELEKIQITFSLSLPARYGPSLFKSESVDVRHGSLYNRTPHQHNTQLQEEPQLEHTNNCRDEDEVLVTGTKRPCLLADVSLRAPRHLDTPSSAESVESRGLVPMSRRTSGGSTSAPPSSPPQVK